MKTAPILFTFLVSFVCLSHCSDLLVGSCFNNRIIWQEKIEYNSIPFKKRVKEAFYSDPGQQIIKGIIARDLDHTNNMVTITAGGVGQSYVNFRFKSERGSSINYQLEICV